MSRDAFSYDPQDAGETRDASRPSELSVNTDRLPVRVHKTEGVRPRTPLAAAIAPKPASSVRPATNAATVRAPITSGIAPYLLPQFRDAAP